MDPDVSPPADAASTGGDAASTASSAGRGRRRLTLVAAGAAVVVLTASALLAVRPGSEVATQSPGRDLGAAPAFSLENVREGGPPVVLERLRGRPVVLNFWASWCAPCRREMPAFQAVARRVGDRVAFVGVNHQDGRSAALDLLRETGLEYPSGYDPRGTVARRYRLVGMPTTVFISADGRLLERRAGEMTRGELERTLRRLYGVSS